MGNACFDAAQDRRTEEVEREMKIYQGFCGYCSIEASDKRILVQDGDVVTCQNCGGKSKLIPIYEGSPYCKMERMNNVKERR
jgi:formylmethanofuran dehydrogenase subunit D